MNSAEKIAFWEQRLRRDESAWYSISQKFDGREALFTGSRYTRPCAKGDKAKNSFHVRNLVAELIEAQVDANIPMPKVTARRPEDEPLAKIIEDMLRDELNRLPFEEMNDMMERTVPIQGGSLFLLEWDSARRTRSTVGELTVRVVHPKEIVPQSGVVTSIEDMDYIILKLPSTRENLRRRFGAEVKGDTGEDLKNGDTVLRYAAYYRNEDGGIGLFSWAGDTVLADYEDYQSPRRGGDYEEVLLPRVTRSGKLIPAGGSGPQRIPVYKPKLYPVILQKSVSVYGRLLGDSDADKIADQQNTSNRLASKILDKIVKAGSFATLPADASICTDNEELKYIRLENAADKSMIDVYDMEGSIQQDITLYNLIYEEARNIIGITDSYQGRRDTTAASGKAKEFAAARAAGRLESKRVMKNAAYARLFEAMFKFKLAYAGEPRPVIRHSALGNTEYGVFDRWDFLERDQSGQWYWNDAFLFSCDTSAVFASNRESMWEETRLNLNQGAFGDPSDPQTLLLFWSKMEQLHYPGASETKRWIKERALTQNQINKE